jgi:hypothetical protein
LEVKVIEPSFASLNRPDRKPIVVAGESMLKIICFIEMPADKIVHTRTIVTLGVYRNGKELERLKVKFIGPIKSKL